MAIQPTLALIPAAQGLFSLITEGSKLYSVLPSNGVGDFDFTRASTATRVNSKGLIEEVASGVSRLDYTGGGCPHHLLEPQSTNLITYSEAFDNAYWNKSGSSVTSGFISPTGALGAFKLVESSANSNHITYAYTLAYVGLNTISLRAKKGERNLLALEFASIGAVAIFDLNNGTVFSSSLLTENIKITPLSDGWYDIAITKDLVSNSTVVASLRDDLGNRTYQGNGTSGVYIFGAQLEQSSYAKSYIPTNGSTVTRLAETADNAGDASTFNDSEGMLFAEISALANGSFRYITLSDGTDSNNVQFGFFPLPKQVQFEVNSGGSSQLGYLDTNIDVLFNTKLCIKYKQNDFSIYVNGFEVHTDSSGLSPIGLDRICFDRGDGCGDNFYGKTKKLEYYNTALTSLEMETLTSYTSFNEMALNFNYTI